MIYRIQENSLLGAPLRRDQHYQIIGAGISGLFIGYYLKKLGISFEIHEKSAKAGGLLNSHDTPFGIVEQAANGFIWCPEIAELCEDLKIDLIGPKPTAKARYLLRKNRFRKFPLSILESIGLLTNLFRKHPEPVETLADFGMKYLGKATTRQVLEPAFAGIYGAPIEDLSFPGALSILAAGINEKPSAFGAIQHLRKKRKSPKGSVSPKGTHSFEGGIAVLAKALESHLSEHIKYQSDGTNWIQSPEQLILCTPAYVSASFFEGSLKQMLNSVDYTPMLTVSVHLEKADCSRFKSGFGVLIPRSEAYKILGVLFNSSIFPNRSKSDSILSLTCILRADSQTPDLMDWNSEQIKSLIQTELQKLIGFSGTFLQVKSYKWAKGIPVYSPELYTNWFEMDRLLKEHYPHIRLFGNYTGQISIRGMCQSASNISVIE